MLENNTAPQVSVIMNCYNGEAFLNEAITSIIHQTYKNWELIFWDNRSDDNSATIAKSYSDKRIKYFLADSHTNLGQARSLALKKASSDWVAFLDTDDLWLPSKLEVQFREVEKMAHPPDLIYSRCDFFYSKSNDNHKRKEAQIFPRMKRLPEKDLYEYLFYGNFLPFPSLVFRRHSIIKLGGIPPYAFSPDYYLSMGLARAGRVLAIDQVLCRYRIRSDSMSIKYKKQGWENSISIVRHYSALDLDSKKTRPIMAAYAISSILDMRIATLRNIIRLQGLTGILCGLMRLVKFQIFSAR